MKSYLVKSPGDEREKGKEKRRGRKINIIEFLVNAKHVTFCLILATRYSAMDSDET